VAIAGTVQGVINNITLEKHVRDCFVYNVHFLISWMAKGNLLDMKVSSSCVP